MFNFLKKKKSEVNSKESIKITVKQFVALLLNDEKLSMPVYLPEIRLVSDGDKLGVGPLIYVWNVEHTTSSFSLSINGKCVGHLLETFISREDPAFVEIRDETMKIISEHSLRAVQATIRKTGVMPDVLFAYSGGEQQ